MKEMIVAGNWKMYNTRKDAIQLVEEIIAGLNLSTLNTKNPDVTRVVICPPFTALDTVATALEQTPLFLGAQTCHHTDKGAFTGEISAMMLSEIGCSFVILGHSERRRDFYETNAIIALKALSATTCNLTPILCVGENLEQRESNDTFKVVTTQIGEFVQHASNECLSKCIIAYEPIWAIGTGRAASAEQAQEVHHTIRTYCTNNFGVQPTILYGGSVNDSNASDFFAQPDIHGALVGGASLQASTFTNIIRAAQDCR